VFLGNSRESGLSETDTSTTAQLSSATVNPNSSFKQDGNSIKLIIKGSPELSVVKSVAHKVDINEATPKDADDTV